jgi:hypothetical protein
MKMVLSMLYGSFDVVRIGEPRDTDEVFEFTMSPSQLRVRLSRRSAGA